ncbi:MAG: hypothetical protein JRN20_09695 [Nitrososphaerota archaeon]|jgi:hypothetical protein|nr:hypothetical protein [Nitrososphaerota archaeon]
MPKLGNPNNGRRDPRNAPENVPHASLDTSLVCGQTRDGKETSEFDQTIDLLMQTLLMREEMIQRELIERTGSGGIEITNQLCVTIIHHLVQSPANLHDAISKAVLSYYHGEVFPRMTAVVAILENIIGDD